MKELLCKNKKAISKFIGAIVFLIIIIQVFLALTYLFRGNQYNYNDRISVVGIKEEKENSLDVIYVGGSAAFVYWEPLHAYSDYGFTSYDLATNSIQAENILAYIKYAQQYQSPDLYVIGVRAFQYFDEVGSEIGLRVTSDSLDMGWNRTQLINTYLNNRSLETDEIALYFDIAKYHTNYTALQNETAWQLIDNSMNCDYKGGQIQTAWCYLEEPKNVKTDKRAELEENDTKTLIELLDYLKKNDLNALFVVCPYFITTEEYAKYNTIGDIVSDYGYEFLNTNDYYQEMGIDFSTDFYHVNHVNSLGARKYTDFLGNYLSQNYNLPDHRDDINYREWQTLAENYILTADSSHATVQNMIESANEAYEIAQNIKKTYDFTEWAALVNDERFTVITAGNCGFKATDVKPQYTSSLSWLNLDDIYGVENYIKIVRKADVIGSNENGVPSITFDIGHFLQKVSCTVDNYSIYIDGIDYSCGDSSNINMVVFDNYHRTIVDAIYLYAEDGNVKIGRNSAEK